MSRETEELARRAFETAARPGVSGLADLLTDDCEWVTDPRVAEPGVYRGRDQVVAYVAGLRRMFETFEFEIHAVRDTDNGILVATTAHGHGGVSGADVHLDWWFVAQVRDGSVARIESFLTEDDALEAVGLSE